MVRDVARGWIETAITASKAVATTQRYVAQYKRTYLLNILEKATMLYGRSLMMQRDTMIVRISFRSEHHDQRDTK